MGPPCCKPNRPTVTPLSSIPESMPTAPRPVAEWKRKELYQRTLLNPGHRRCVRTCRQIHFTRASLRPGTWNRAARASPPHRELSKQNQLRFNWASIQVSAAGTARYKEAWRLSRNCLDTFGPTAAGPYPNADLRTKTCSASPAPGAKAGPRKSGANENPRVLLS